MAEKREALAKWMQPEVSEQRVQRLLSAVVDADGRRGWPKWVLVPVAASVMLGIALVVSLATRPEELVQGAEVIASADPQVAHFADGSTAELGPSSALSLVEQHAGLVSVKLHSGRATFEVSKKPERHFVVQVRDVRVRVVGTRFTMSDHGGVIEVSVEHGVVEVVRGDETQWLTAGQSWHSSAAVEARADEGLGEAEAAPEALAPDEVVAPDEAIAPTTAPALRVKPAVRRPARRSAAPVSGPAEDLFQSALIARREGRHADAAKGLERFVHDSPQDARAAVAAFELGRIRMDALGETKAAVEALHLSLRLDGRAAFREEAMSRLVRAYDRLSDVAGCVQARDAYLSMFPAGAYASGMQGRCSGGIAR